MKFCKVEGCERKATRRGWCGIHYERWRKYGDPLFVKQIHGDNVKRFWSYIDKKSDNDCWEWIGWKYPKGYGGFHINGKVTYAHRYCWQLHNGEIPDGLHVLHNCFNKSCVNPSHLRLGTNQDNHNDWDFIGDRNPKATVPDCVVKDVVRRYRAGYVTYQSLAEELTILGWVVTPQTIGRWVRGVYRKQPKEIPKWQK